VGESGSESDTENENERVRMNNKFCFVYERREEKRRETSSLFVKADNISATCCTCKYKNTWMR
jgi:hypothetical protein